MQKSLEHGKKNQCEASDTRLLVEKDTEFMKNSEQSHIQYINNQPLLPHKIHESHQQAIEHT